MKVLFAGIVFAMLFGTYVTLSMGPVAGAEWFALHFLLAFWQHIRRYSQALGDVLARFACYVIEYSLSVDNLFVFIAQSLDFAVQLALAA